MHKPASDARPSVFFHYDVHPYCHPAEMDGQRPVKAVVVVGAGPIGLTTALDLARFGVPVTIIEEDLQLSQGSRAIVLTRRSLEILQQLGVQRPFLDKGLPWSHGRSFFRGREIYRMIMPHDEDDRYLPALNIQQQYIEEYLVKYCEQERLIDIRWGQKVTGVSQTGSSATLRIDTPEGEYELVADWVVAADGGRSTVRKLMQLRMEGRSYPGNFVIADIRAKIDLPTERLCYFDPPWNPGNNVLVHRQPDDIWRIDFRLPDGETAEKALEPELLHQRINAVLEMIHQRNEWHLDWATVYSANTLTLADYVHGRVLLTGDAAHLLPIFGVRGINTGLQDCNDMAWKLAYVINGWADPGLLQSYTQERVQAAREICEEAGKSTRFMTPPTRGTRLLRDAVLSFSLSEDFFKDLMHWRTSRPHDYHNSPLNSFPDSDRQFDGGVGLGQPLRNVKLGTEDFFLDRLGSRAGFHLLLFVGENALTPALREILTFSANAPFPIFRVVIGANARAAADQADVLIFDEDKRICDKYDGIPGTVYLVRPDFHVCARWHEATMDQVAQALRRVVAR
jgi:3-(3-hydroxy-phenyl)propionate hydroxylase